MSEEPQKIVALVGDSAYSASVCDHAAWLSGRTGAPVELIHVLGRREAPERPDLSGPSRLAPAPPCRRNAAGLMAETAILPGQPETARGKLVEQALFDLLVMGPTAIRASAALIIGHHHRHDPILLGACRLDALTSFPGIIPPRQE